MAENFAQTSRGIKKKLIKSSSSTDILLVPLRHIWVINDFTHQLRKDTYLESPIFSTEANNGKLKWYLNLKIVGKQISLFLIRCYNSKAIKVKYTLGIVNAKGNDVKIVSQVRKFDKDDCRWGEKNFLKKDSFFEEDNIYLSDDTLTIFCEIANALMVDRNNHLGTFTTPQMELANDFALMFENRDWCDVILSAGGKEFPAHKVILAARSPVFRVMFLHDMEESRKNRVDITDLDEEGLNEMLRYMYTGEVHKLEEVAPRLLGIAEKYAMDGFKIRCEKALVENLSVENAAETFILSDTFRATELKHRVKLFIVGHAEEVGNTSGFESMVRTHPHLGVEAFRVLSNPSIIKY